MQGQKVIHRPDPTKTQPDSHLPNNGSLTNDAAADTLAELEAEMRDTLEFIGFIAAESDAIGDWERGTSLTILGQMSIDKVTATMMKSIMKPPGDLGPLHIAGHCAPSLKVLSYILHPYVELMWPRCYVQ
jgi:hypothetical protein